MSIISKSPEEFLDIPKNKFNNKDILITGSTSGIGKELALSLGRKGSNVFIHGRDKEKGRKIVKQIKENYGSKANFLRADFSNLNQTRSVVDRLNEETESLDYLINNAGCYYRGKQKSAGYEHTFVVNHISSYVMTLKCIPLLRKGDNKKVVTTASEAHRSIEKLSFGEIRNSNNNWRSYCRSKLFNIMFSQYMDEKVDDITFNSIHPGAIPSSGLYRNLPMSIGKIGKVADIVPLPAVTSESEGAAMIYYGMLSDKNSPGSYFVDFSLDRPSKIAENTDYQKKLIKISEDITQMDISEHLDN